MNSNHQKVVKGICEICSGGCGVELTIEDKKIIDVKGQMNHPISRGFLCAKGKAIKEIVNAPDRIRKPLMKAADGSFQEVSWEDALSLIADNLAKVKKECGPEAVAFHSGKAGVGKEFTHYLERLCRVFGSPNFSTAGSHCHLSKSMANVYTCGELPTPDYHHSKCIVLWGYNPSQTCPPEAQVIREACQREAKLIVVDPRTTFLAKTADLHLQVRPGTDGALALGMLHVIVRENLYHKDFVEKWTIGFEELVDSLAVYDPLRVSEITGVPENLIIEAARMYAQTGPACIYQGIAVELQSNGFQTARAIAILQAVTGNLGVRGGGLLIPRLKLKELPNCSFDPIIKTAIGQERFPLYYQYTNNAQGNIYTEAILEGRPYPIKAMVIMGSNPLLSWPNAKKVEKAFRELELLVVVDHFMTDTAKLADVVIPTAMFLARPELWSNSHINGEGRVGLCPKVWEEDQMTDWQFIFELAKKMGYEEFFPWESEEEALNERIRDLGLSLEALKESSEGHIFYHSTDKSYEKELFKTPSGKVEIYSQRLKDSGYDSLPVYQEPSEGPISAPETAAEYPFVLTTSSRILPYMHSRYHNIPSLRKLSPEPLLNLNQLTADQLGICEGEIVLVESLRGNIEIKVHLVDDITPQVMFITHGWSEANVNHLTDNRELDPVTGFPPDCALLVRIKKQ